MDTSKNILPSPTFFSVCKMKALQIKEPGFRNHPSNLIYSVINLSKVSIFEAKILPKQNPHISTLKQNPLGHFQIRLTQTEHEAQIEPKIETFSHKTTT